MTGSTYSTIDLSKVEFLSPLNGRHSGEITAQDDIILAEAQLIAMQRKKEKREAFGEIETGHPCYLGSQDIYQSIKASACY